MAEDVTTIAIRRCHLVIFAPISESKQDVDLLESLFDALDLPVSICAEDFVDRNVLKRLVDQIGAPRAIRESKIVLLCGAFLEEQISVSARRLLVNGYETYLVRDLVKSKDIEHAHIHDQRLSTAGVVSVTAKQLIYEWATTEGEPILRRFLTQFLGKS